MNFQTGTLRKQPAIKNKSITKSGDTINKSAQQTDIVATVRSKTGSRYYSKTEATFHALKKYIFLYIA